MALELDCCGFIYIKNKILPLGVFLFAREQGFEHSRRRFLWGQHVH